ncbi:MAG: PD-(D/E)XK nuclease family protein [Thiolinea sp.]
MPLLWRKNPLLKRIIPPAKPHTPIGSPVRQQFARKHTPLWRIKPFYTAQDCTVAQYPRKLASLAARKDLYFSHFPASQCLQGFPLGNLHSPQHFFHYPSIQWGFQLQEPQVSRALAHFLAQSPLLCRSFIEALFATGQPEDDSEATPAPDFANRRNYADFAASYRVQAEAPTAQAQRIDLVITWKQAGEACCLVMECKFGHHLTQGQLPAYQQYAAAHSDHEHLYCFVVARRYSRPDRHKLRHRRNRSFWRQVEWLALLRRWEHALTQEEPRLEQSLALLEDFPRFRRTLWERATGQ